MYKRQPNVIDVWAVAKLNASDSFSLWDTNQQNTLRRTHAQSQRQQRVGGAKKDCIDRRGPSINFEGAVFLQNTRSDIRTGGTPRTSCPPLLCSTPGTIRGNLGSKFRFLFCLRFGFALALVGFQMRAQAVHYLVFV